MYKDTPLTHTCMSKGVHVVLSSKAIAIFACSLFHLDIAHEQPNCLNQVVHSLSSLHPLINLMLCM